MAINCAARDGSAATSSPCRYFRPISSSARGFPALANADSRSSGVALEGNEAEVHALKAEIIKDPRHNNFVTLLDGACSKREFPDWSMGFQNLDELDPREIPGYSTFLDSPLRAHMFTDSLANCRRLLLLFKNKEHASRAR